MNRPHFLITCFPIQGHINPAIHLAKNLARASAIVTFSTTVRGLEKVKSLGSLPTVEGLSYTPFSDGHDAWDIEHAADFDTYMTDMRKFGSESLAKIIREFGVVGCPVTCLVYSLLLPWVASVARDVGVPSAFLAIQCATALAIYHRFYNGRDGMYERGVDSCLKIDTLPTFRLNDLPSFLLPDDRLRPLMQPIMLEHVRELESDDRPLVLLNTFEELETEAIKALNDEMNVLTIGPLIPSEASDNNSFGMDLFNKSNDHNYLEWLDSKPKRSVVFIAFGSVVPLNKEHKLEIACGLATSGRPFLWVIRSSSLINIDEDITKVVEKEVGNGEGMIVPWCSQIRVLSHASVGCFVTHCGWNSTLESLTRGVATIGFPQFSDQPTNAKLVEEVWRVGLRGRSHMVEGEELKELLNVVMEEGERGKEIRDSVVKWKSLAMDAIKKGGSSYNNLIKVLELYYP